MKVMIKYAFIFEPAETWPQHSKFEADLGVFFKERGLEAELVKTLEGQESVRVVYIKRAESPATEKIKDTPVKKQLSSMAKLVKDR